MAINGENYFSRFENDADQGVASAQFELGLMYSTGHGAPLDYVTAHKWFNLACMQGVAEARDHRADLARDMSSAEIAEAQKLAREWVHIH